MRRARPLLGTLVEIRIPDGDHGRAVEAAFRAVEKVHRLMSRHDAESDVARINRAKPGERVAIDRWTQRVLRRAWEISAATGGVFDCSAGSGADCRDLELLGGTSVRLRRPVRLTLDGIAKGFAVDRAVAALRRAGVRSGAVNAGGDLRLFGAIAEPVHVRHPGRPSRLVPIGTIRDHAVATSALYFSRGRRRGVPDSTIVDPRNGKSCRSRASATVIARDCMTADALTKAVLLDPGGAPRALRRLRARAILVRTEGTAA
jgi:thiamine biosynthesis lipoprotein